MNRLTAIVLAILLAATANAADYYEVIDLDVPTDSSPIFSINNGGQIVGSFYGNAMIIDPTGDGNHAPIAPEVLSSSAWANNDNGQIVGQVALTPETVYASLFDTSGAGNHIELETFSVPLSINNNGQVVGQGATPHGNYRATFYDIGIGITVDLGTLGGQDALAWSINDNGQIVGWAAAADGTDHATLFDASDPNNNIDLGGDDGSWARDINNNGQIIGHQFDEHGFSPAVIFDITGQGNNITLDPSGQSAVEPIAINDNGLIVGEAHNLIEQYTYAMLIDASEPDKVINLNDLVDAEGVWLYRAIAINNQGQILCGGNGISENWETFLLNPCNYDLSGDVDNNCRVDLADFAKMAGNWMVDCFDTPSDPACVTIP